MAIIETGKRCCKCLSGGAEGEEVLLKEHVDGPGIPSKCSADHLDGVFCSCISSLMAEFPRSMRCHNGI